MSKSSELLELFDRPEPTVFILVNWLDKDQLGKTDRFLDAVMAKKLSSNVYAVNQNGDYIQKANVGDVKKFQVGKFSEPFHTLN